MKITLKKNDILVLVDLEHRLIENYNNGTPFKQKEEDRLIIGKILDEVRNNGRDF